MHHAAIWGKSAPGSGNSTRRAPGAEGSLVLGLQQGARVAGAEARAAGDDAGTRGRRGASMLFRRARWEPREGFEMTVFQRPRLRAGVRPEAGSHCELLPRFSLEVLVALAMRLQQAG